MENLLQKSVSKPLINDFYNIHSMPPTAEFKGKSSRYFSDLVVNN